MTHTRNDKLKSIELLKYAQIIESRKKSYEPQIVGINKEALRSSRSTLIFTQQTLNDITHGQRKMQQNEKQINQFWLLLNLHHINVLPTPKINTSKSDYQRSKTIVLPCYCCAREFRRNIGEKR